MPDLVQVPTPTRPRGKPVAVDEADKRSGTRVSLPDEVAGAADEEDRLAAAIAEALQRLQREEDGAGDDADAPDDPDGSAGASAGDDGDDDDDDGYEDEVHRGEVVSSPLRVDSPMLGSEAEVAAAMLSVLLSPLAAAHATEAASTHDAPATVGARDDVPPGPVS